MIKIHKFWCQQSLKQQYRRPGLPHHIVSHAVARMRTGVFLTMYPVSSKRNAIPATNVSHIANSKFPSSHIKKGKETNGITPGNIFYLIQYIGNIISTCNQSKNC